MSDPIMRRAGATALLLTAGLAAFSCRGKETPAAGGQPAAPAPAGAPQPEPTFPPERRPTIRAAAEPNRPPFAGLKGPRDAAVDSRGRIWVANFGATSIEIFDSSGGALGGFGSRGKGNYGLKDPCGIAIQGDNVYVVDTWNGRVELFSLSGEWKAKSPGDYYGPRGVAVAPNGNVWFTDSGNQRVILCEKDLSKPRPFGKFGSGAEQFSSPVGIAVGPSGDVYVADTNNQRVQILDAQGTFKGRWKFSGWGPNSEAYLEADDDGSLYASDPPGQAVVHLDRNGREIQRWKADDAGARFSRPTGIALDHKSRTLYVVNSDADTIGKLKLSAKP